MSDQYTHEAAQMAHRLPELRGLTYSSGVLDTRFRSLLSYKRDIEANRTVIEGLDKTQSLNVVNHYIWLNETALQVFKAEHIRNRRRRGWRIIAVTALIVGLVFTVPSLFALFSFWSTGGPRPSSEPVDNLVLASMR